VNQLVKTKGQSLLMDPAAFDHMQRVGQMLAMSQLFPEALRKGTKETAIANAVLVMNMAARLGEDPLTVAQNIYFVSGKPGWSSSYMIGKANQHGVFKNPINWDISGEGDNLSITAFAELAATGQRVEATCDMAMAKAEGWTKNQKYKSMPQQMLRYRSATFLIRLYCPEVMVGVPAQVEVEFGMRDITPEDAVMRHSAPMPEKIPDASIVIDKPKSAPKPKAEPKPNPAADKALDDEAKRVAQKRDEEQRTKAEAETPDHDPDTGEILEAPHPDMEQFQELYNTIVNDLMDATDPNEVVDMYAAQIEQMKESVPQLHQQLMAEVAAAAE